MTLSARGGRSPSRVRSASRATREVGRALRWLALLAACAVPTQAVAQSLRIVRTADLGFGTVAPRQLRTVQPSDVAAAVFTVTGRASATLQATVVLPAQLVSSTGVVAPSAWTATVATGAGGSPVSIVPVSGSTFAVTTGADGIATLRIGATLQPAMATASGTFSGAITMVATDPVTGANSLTAQGVATATVLTPLTLLATPMYFPRVYGGVPAVLDPLAATALRINVDGALASTVDVTFEALPTELLKGDGTPVPIGSWLARSGNECAGAASSVSTGTVLSLGLNSPVSGQGRSSLCLGGTITPSALQPGGIYTGTITISIKYTGA